jgi:dihydrofolate synthase / folylpolyglutamate synthase
MAQVQPMNRTSTAYKTLLSELYGRNLFSKGKYDLSRMQELLLHVGNPEKSLRTIHVGGTNGKGSTATKIAAALQHEGYRVGLFTSPHIATYRERIQINQNLISIEEVEHYLQRLLPLSPDATFFELTTAMGLLYFAKEKVDFAVIEVGLGGRLDATNVISPELTVITSIGLDHTEILGHTLEEILEEKKGIIKPPIPCILGPKVPRFTSKAPLFWADSSSAFYDEENQATAKMALSLLQKKFTLSSQSIEYALKIRPPCRLEWLAKDIVLDVAHNPHGFHALLNALPPGPKAFILAISKTKDIRAILQIIKPECVYLIMTEAKNGRSYPADYLEKEALSLGFSAERLLCKKSPQEAITFLLTLPYLKVACGSFFIMKDVKNALGITLAEDPFDMNERQG